MASARATGETAYEDPVLVEVELEVSNSVWRVKDNCVRDYRLDYWVYYKV